MLLPEPCIDDCAPVEPVEPVAPSVLDAPPPIFGGALAASETRAVVGDLIAYLASL